MLTIGAKVSEFEGETQVIIQVRDVNEYSPQLIRKIYETQITEADDRHLPKPILRVSVFEFSFSTLHK